jgi:peptidyl-prolyl cis-trans isomerase C
MGLAKINGIFLQKEDESLDFESLRERAFTELLRQEAVKLGLLSRIEDLQAPNLTLEQKEVINGMLESEVFSPEPTFEEAKRYYDTHHSQYKVGQAIWVRHILFAVTPGVNVQALAHRAEIILLELSNCPSGAQGGDLGWLTPQDCAHEFAKALFFQNEFSQNRGLRPRLLHSRYGFHIVDVLEINPGHLPDFTQLSSQIIFSLQWQSRATALGQYMRRLVGRAHVKGLVLESDVSQLLQ